MEGIEWLSSKQPHFSLETGNMDSAETELNILLACKA
jgi:hypothetical protein